MLLYILAYRDIDTAINIIVDFILNGIKEEKNE